MVMEHTDAGWMLQILDGDSFLLKAMGSGLWPAMVLVSEIVQTFILADFWYVLLDLKLAPWHLHESYPPLLEQFRVMLTG